MLENILKNKNTKTITSFESATVWFSPPIGIGDDSFEDASSLLVGNTSFWALLLFVSDCVANDTLKLDSEANDDGLGDRLDDTGDDCRIEPLVNDSPWLRIIGSVATLRTSSADFFLIVINSHDNLLEFPAIFATAKA